MTYNALKQIENNYKNLKLTDDDFETIDETIFNSFKKTESKIRKLRKLKETEIKLK